MHVAVIGAGALGSVYGVRLAALAHVDVSFVVRTPRDTPLVIERIDGDRARHQIAAPRRTTALAPEADVVLLCVSATDLGDALVTQLGEHDAPIVSLTPLLPHAHERLRRAWGKRLLPGMPSIIAYRPEGADVVRYWLPRVATTFVEEPRPLLPAVDALVRSLQDAGISSRLQMGTFEMNAATTVTFLPLAFAIDVAGSTDAFLEDRDLVQLAIAAAHEGKELGKALGKPASWAELLTHFVGPLTLKMGIALARNRSPEGVTYVEHHFGKKMHAQNVAMAQELVELARERRLPHVAMDELARRVRERPSR